MSRTHNETDIYPYSVRDLSRFDTLVIAPHPDDESLGCGGSIIKHVNSGSRVKVIFLTDGDSGDFNGIYGKEYVSLRRASAGEALMILGVRDYEFWGYKDRGVATVSEEITDRLRQAIKGFSPDLIYVPSPFEVHPDHRTASVIGWRIFKETGVRVIFYEVIVALYPNILVDITSEIEKKKEAIRCYHTELYYNDYLSCIEGLNRFRTFTLPKEMRFAEGFVLFDGGVEGNEPCMRLFSSLLNQQG
jgi:LmbE family N-acetylglucosaminyl deacetylase